MKVKKENTTRIPRTNKNKYIIQLFTIINANDCCSENIILTELNKSTSWEFCN